MIWSQSVEFGRTAKDETAFPAQLELRESGLGHKVTSQRTIKKKKPPLFLTDCLEKPLLSSYLVKHFLARNWGFTVITSTFQLPL